MTLREVSSQLYPLSLDGFFNREKFTKAQLHSYLVTMLCQSLPGKITKPERIVMEIALPDGWWFISVTRYGNRTGQYDYWIPDTREDPIALWNNLFEAYQTETA